MNIYIVVAVWKNTRSNHAGMLHLANRLKLDHSPKVKLIKIHVRGSWYLTPFYRLLNVVIGVYLRLKVKKEDCVFLMEYLLPVCEQSDIALLVKNKAKIFAIAHLVPKRIEKQYTDKEILFKLSLVDALFVLGTSLKDFFISKGIARDKIFTIPHYADTDYYFPQVREPLVGKAPLNVICMGNMERNYNLMAKVIAKLPFINFHICMGMAKANSYFKNLQNVSIYGFLEENELLFLMQKCDISFNVMNDTIGSNVIATSLATGLVIVASNVGSIKDYVITDYNGLLFDTIEDAVLSLDRLHRNRDLLFKMRTNTIEKSKEISMSIIEDLILCHMNNSSESL